jgi:MFS family permease
MLVALAPAGQSPPFPLFATALLTIGLGMGSSVPTLFRVIVERVDPKRAGLVGGMSNSTLQVSAALGVALLGGLFFAVLGGRGDPGSIAHAFSITLLGIAGCHLLGAALGAGLGQPRRARERVTVMAKSCPAPAE